MLKTFVLTLLALIFMRIFGMVQVGETTRAIVKAAAEVFPLLNAHARAYYMSCFSFNIIRETDWKILIDFNQDIIRRILVRGP